MKPIINVATIGHVDHGKTTLACAVTSFLATKGLADVHEFSEAAGEPQEVEHGISIAASHVEYETVKRHYVHMDCPGNDDYIKCIITGAAKLDGAILVVSALEGPMQQTRDHIRLSKEAGVSKVVVYINKAELVDDPELLDLIELEIRELLLRFEFPGNEVPVIRGSALKAASGDLSELGFGSIEKLLEALDNYIPEPAKPNDEPFLMTVEEVFEIEGRGTVASGKIERGTVKTGQEIEIIGIRDTRSIPVTAIEKLRKSFDEVEAGENAELIFRDLKIEDLERGQVVAKPGSISPSKKFTALIYILTKEEGGRHTPFFKGYRPQFYFRTTDISGVIELPENMEMVTPGSYVTVNVELTKRVAIEKGLRFAIRESGRTVGAGVVSDIMD